MIFAAVQNGVVLDVFDTYDEAYDRVKEEIERDRLSILFKRKLRKLLKRSGNVALHQYSIFKITEAVDIK